MLNRLIDFLIIVAYSWLTAALIAMPLNMTLATRWAAMASTISAFALVLGLTLYTAQLYRWYVNA